MFRKIHNTLIRVTLGVGIMENFQLLYHKFLYLNFYNQKKNQGNCVSPLPIKAPSLLVL